MVDTEFNGDELWKVYKLDKLFLAVTKKYGLGDLRKKNVCGYTPRQLNEMMENRTSKKSMDMMEDIGKEERSKVRYTVDRYRRENGLPPREKNQGPLTKEAALRDALIKSMVKRGKPDEDILRLVRGVRKTIISNIAKHRG